MPVHQYTSEGKKDGKSTGGFDLFISFFYFNLSNLIQSKVIHNPAYPLSFPTHMPLIVKLGIFTWQNI